MAGFVNVKELITEAYTNGKNWYNVFRKVPAIATTLGIWMDLSSAPGSPRPNYKLGDELTAILFNGAYGIYHGSPTTTDGFKFLQKFMIGCASAVVLPATFILCDYLLFYPIIDMDNVDFQDFLPGVPTPLPRYVDGEGVKAFLVATNPYAGGQQFRIRYTNQAGTTGQVSEWVTTNTATNISTIVNSGIGGALRGPFIQLQVGDRGIRSVQGIEMFAPNGGLAALVLVKPLATIAATDPLVVSETDFLIDIPSLPKIYDGAYLNLLCYPNGSAVGVPIFGELTTIWR